MSHNFSYDNVSNCARHSHSSGKSALVSIAKSTRAIGGNEVWVESQNRIGKFNIYVVRILRQSMKTMVGVLPFLHERCGYVFIEDLRNFSRQFISPETLENFIYTFKF